MAIDFTKADVPAVGRPVKEPSEYAHIVKALNADRTHALAATLKDESEAQTLVQTLRNDARKLGLAVTVRSKTRTDAKGTHLSVWVVDQIKHERKPKPADNDASAPSNDNSAPSDDASPVSA